jgi:hypothetical protein
MAEQQPILSNTEKKEKAALGYSRSNHRLNPDLIDSPCRYLADNPHISSIRNIPIKSVDD